jgi:trk system potassium uptake protein
MYIILVGGGKVGYHLADGLIKEGHEVLVIEKDRERIEMITNELGSVCMHGDGCETSVLAEAGTARADMLIAVTGDDEDNLVACQVAKHAFQVPRTIARSNNPNNEPLFRTLGIDVTVSATNVIMENIEQEVPTHVLTHLLSIRDTGMEIVGIKITAEAKSIGKKIKDIKLPEDSVLNFIIRKEEKPIMTDDETVIETGDEIIAVTPLEKEDALKTALIGD